MIENVSLKNIEFFGLFNILPSTKQIYVPSVAQIQI